MKKCKPTERERQIYEWKVKGGTLSWARWCQLLGIRVRPKRPPVAHSDAYKPRQRVLLHKVAHGSGK